MAWYWIAAIVVGALWLVGFGIASGACCEHGVSYQGACSSCRNRRWRWWGALPFRLLPVYLPRLLVWLIEVAIPDLLQESSAAWGSQRKETEVK